MLRVILRNINILFRVVRNTLQSFFADDIGKISLIVPLGDWCLLIVLCLKDKA